ncbi:M15 family metallopeptidase [Paenibacillus abyssi]|uniref:Peptidoglycan L-alanyl-D-glutamate endopeptidase CwlK n=1 Tax=Paenibacillus abyssi TaxID=1340531 RepID=A0A917D2A5_9BACL|nr:M15 family metallopeptidase [Paenibacillus abyssi]GGG08367.1 peptidoglycan L-alanyl-D-glutamate endopeptidase CwlK [Paenibacillus abyssi]
MLLLMVWAVMAAVIWRGIEALEWSIPESVIEPAPPVTELHPTVLAKKNELVAETRKIGITIMITDGFRSHEEQNIIYEQGRTAIGQIVTNARGGESYHNYGLAIDFALRLADGSVIWDLEHDGNGNGKSDWMEVVGIAKGLGFTWGGDWDRFPDYPHLQMDFGYSIRELQRGKRPSVDEQADS